MTRRGFVQKASLGFVASVLGTKSRPESLQAVVDNSVPLKIIRIDAVTFRKDIRIGGGSGGSDGAEFLWVRLHTDEGWVGTGETYPFTQGEAGALRDYSRRIIGQDPRPGGYQDGHLCGLLGAV